MHIHLPVTDSGQFGCKIILKSCCSHNLPTAQCCTVNAGKYPHLVVACDGVTVNSPDFELLVKFGSVPVGHTAEKWIEILNLSPVRKFTNRN